MANALVASNGPDDSQSSSDYERAPLPSNVYLNADSSSIYSDLKRLINLQQWMQFKAKFRDLLALPNLKKEGNGVVRKVLLPSKRLKGKPSLAVAACQQAGLPLDVVRLLVNSPEILPFQEELLFETNPETNRTALHEAVVNGTSVAVVKCLLDAAQNVLATQLGVFLASRSQRADISEPVLKEESSIRTGNGAHSDEHEEAEHIFPSLLQMDPPEMNSPLHDAIQLNRGLELITMLVQYDEKLQQYNRRKPTTMPVILQPNTELQVPLYIACERAIGISGATSLSSTPVLKYLILATYRTHMLRDPQARVSPFSMSLLNSPSILLRATLKCTPYMGEHSHKVIKLVAEFVPSQLWQYYKPDDGGPKKMLIDWVQKVISEPVPSPIGAMRRLSITEKKYHSYPKTAQTSSNDDEVGSTDSVGGEDAAGDKKTKKRK